MAQTGQLIPMAQWFRNSQHDGHSLHRQETPNSVGGWEVDVPDTSNSSYMEQQQMRLDIIATRPCQKNFHTSTNAESAEHLRQLNARTSWGGFHRITTRSSQKYLHEVRHHVRTPRRFHRDLVKSFSQGPVQDHEKASDGDLHKSFSQGFVKDLDP